MLYTLEEMDEIFQDLELQSIILEGGKEFTIFLSDKVRQTLENGKITLNSIECSLLNMPDSLFKQINGNEDFLFDCKEANTRLVLSVREQTLEVLVARYIKDFPIF